MFASGTPEVSPERRTLASLRWDPVFGDRAQEIVVVTDQTAPEEIEVALRGAGPREQGVDTGR